MRQSTLRPPLIGIAADGASHFGRAVMRGAMRFLNTQRVAEIHSVLRGTFDERPGPWPRCDGAILAGVGGRLEARVRASTRHVVSCSGSTRAGCHVVCLDDVAAGRLAGQHLVDCRIRSFAFYGNADSPHSVNRHLGFSEELARLGHPCSTGPVRYPGPGLDRRHWPQLIEWIRSLPKPVGIFAVDDSAAFDLAAACHHARFAVPEQVALLGVNNDDLLCESALPPLSSVDAGYARMGFAAAKRLQQLLADEPIPEDEVRLRLPPVQVVRRQSTDILAVETPEVAEALKYIRLHACDPCGVSDVARHVAVGRRWIERQFMRTLGRTPGDEILRVQILTAKRLLLDAGVSIPEVASRCGFSSASTFGRAFLRMEAVTPARYRRGTSG